MPPIINFTYRVNLSHVLGGVAKQDLKSVGDVRVIIEAQLFLHHRPLSGEKMPPVINFLRHGVLLSIFDLYL